jgi:hypothetical protein
MVSTFAKTPNFLQLARSLWALIVLFKLSMHQEQDTGVGMHAGGTVGV